MSSTLTWQFEGRAVADDVDFTAGGYSLRNTSRSRPCLSLITGVLDYRPLPELRVSVGNQIVNWSAFDEIQPANLMTARDVKSTMTTRPSRSTIREISLSTLVLTR